MLYVVAYIDSNNILQLFGVIISKFVAKVYTINIIIVVMIRYNPMFVIDICIFSRKLTFRDNKSLIVN